MKTLQSLCRPGLPTLFALLAMVDVAWAQTALSGQVNTPGGGTPGGGHYGFLACPFVVGLLVLVGVAVKLFDAALALIRREAASLIGDTRI